MQYRHEWKHEISIFDVLCLRIAGGGITVNSCSEGIESPEIFIEDGDITVTSTDDGINACGMETADGSLPGVTINGGTVTLLNPSGRDADGIDSNGNIDINGGLVYISLVGDGSNCALDYGSENGGVCRINGGTVVACGGLSPAIVPHCRTNIILDQDLLLDGLLAIYRRNAPPKQQ